MLACSSLVVSITSVASSFVVKLRDVCNSPIIHVMFFMVAMHIFIQAVRSSIVCHLIAFLSEVNRRRQP